jgi:hypothetical protein
MDGRTKRFYVPKNLTHQILTTDLVSDVNLAHPRPHPSTAMPNQNNFRISAPRRFLDTLEHVMTYMKKHATGSSSVVPMHKTDKHFCGIQMLEARNIRGLKIYIDQFPNVRFSWKPITNNAYKWRAGFDEVEDLDCEQLPALFTRYASSNDDETAVTIAGDLYTNSKHGESVVVFPFNKIPPAQVKAWAADFGLDAFINGPKTIVRLPEPVDEE